MYIFHEISTDELTDSRCLSIEKLIEIYPVIADHYEMFRVAWRNSNLMFAESTMTDGCFLSMLDWHEYTFTEIVQLVSRLNSTLDTLAR